MGNSNFNNCQSWTKLGLSQDQAGTNLALSWQQVVSLLNFAQKPHPTKEMMELLEWKNRTKFRKKYINPLLEISVLNMTIPDSL
jgi:ATP-dependent DNA helicase RecG